MRNNASCDSFSLTLVIASFTDETKEVSSLSIIESNLHASMSERDHGFLKDDNFAIEKMRDLLKSKDNVFTPSKSRRFTISALEHAPVLSDQSAPLERT